MKNPRKFIILNFSALGLLLFFFTLNSSYSQNFIIEGKVTDELNHEGVPNVNVFSNDSLGTVTNSEGLYRLSFQNNISKTLTFQSLGFQPVLKKIDWKNNSRISMNVQLKEIIIPLEQIVVSSSRFKQELNEVSVSMELLKPSAIENSNAVTLDKALDKVPGVNVLDGQINIRGGSGYSYGAGSRVMILVDDMPMLSADANDVKWKFIPTEMTEQVEIIKGASSAIYGSSALGGVINLRTKYARNKPVTELRYFHGTYLEPRNKDFKWRDTVSFYRGYSVFHSQKVNRLDISVGATTFNDDGYRQGEFNSYIRLNANFLYHSKINGLSYGLNLGNMNDNGGLFFYWLSDKKPFLPAPNTISKYNNYRSQLDPYIIYTGKNGNKHSLRNRVYNTTNTNSTNQESNATGYYSEYLYQKLFKFTEKSHLNLSTGIVTSRTIIYSDSLYGDHKGYNDGIFLQADPKLGPLAFSLGARVESFKVDAFNRIYSPVFRSGVSVNLWKSGYIRASAGQGFRYPSVAELFTETQAGSVKVYPNPALKPEKSFSQEIGFRQGFKFKQIQGYMDVAVFSTEYENFMEYTFGLYNIPPGAIPTPANYIKYGGFQSKNVTNRALINGIESIIFLEENYRELKIQLITGHTWLDPIDLDYQFTEYDILGVGYDNMLKYRFRNLTKVNFNLLYKKVELGGELRYNSFMQNIDKIFNMIIPGIYNYRLNNNSGDYIIDAHISFNLTEKWKLNLVSKNLLNRAYMYIPGNLGAPVSFVAQMELKL